jgi:type III restriction enzyme
LIAILRKNIARRVVLDFLGEPSLSGPGKLERIDLNPFRSGRRMQELVFQMARDLTREYVSQ